MSASECKDTCAYVRTYSVFSSRAKPNRGAVHQTLGRLVVSEATYQVLIRGHANLPLCTEYHFEAVPFIYVLEKYDRNGYRRIAFCTGICSFTV